MVIRFYLEPMNPDYKIRAWSAIFVIGISILNGSKRGAVT